MGGFSSTRLSKALRREFQENLQIDITLADYHMLQAQFLDDIFAYADSSENTKFQFTQWISRLHVPLEPQV
jgi:hypothetical protein